MALYSLGTSNWTNGSKYVTLTASTIYNNIITLMSEGTEDAPIYGRKWGTTSTITGPTGTHKVIEVAAAPGVTSNAVGGAILYDGSKSGYQAPASANILNFTAKFTGNDTDGRFSVVVSSSTNNTTLITTGAVPLPASVDGVWTKFVVSIPYVVNEFHSIHIFHTVDGTPYTETMAVDSVYLTQPTYPQYSLNIGDTISADGGTTQYNIDYVWRLGSNSNASVILSAPFAGTTGAYTATRNDKTNGYDLGIGSVNTNRKILFSNLQSGVVLTTLNMYNDNIGASGSLVATANGTNTIASVYDPTQSYAGNNLSITPEVTVTGTGCNAITYDPQNATYHPGFSLSNPTKFCITLRTTGNNVANGWWAKLRKTAGSDSGAVYAYLPATADGVWTSLVLNINPSSHNLREIVIMPTSGNFATGVKVAVSNAYITTSAVRVPFIGGTISPDLGKTNYTIDKVLVSANGASQPWYNIYHKEALTNITGSYSWRRDVGPVASAGVSRTLSATVDNTSVISGSVSKEIVLATSITNTSSVSGTISTAPVVIKSFSAVINAVSTYTAPAINYLIKLVSGISGASAVAGTVDTVNAGFSLGTATWTNGSKLVTFQAANPNVVMLNDFYPYTDANTGGLTAAGEWGTGTTDGIGADDYEDNVVKYDSSRAAPSLTYKNLLIYGDISTEDGLAIHRDNSQAARVMRSGSATYLNSSNLQVLNFVATMYNNYGGYLSVSASNAVTGTVVTANSVQLPLTPNNITSFHKFVIPIPNNIATFKQLSIFHTINNTYLFNESLTIDSVYLTNNAPGAIHMTDKVSPDGGVSLYRIAKVLQNSSGVITLVLETAYSGATVTVDTTRKPAESFHANVPALTTVTAPTFTRLQYLFATISNIGNTAGSLMLTHNISAAIGATSTVINNRLSRLRGMIADIGGSAVVNGGVTLVKSLAASIAAIGDSPAVEFIRYKFYDAIITAGNDIRAHIGQARFFGSSVDATSEIISTRTRLQFYTAEVVNGGMSVLVSTLGYAKALTSEVINAVTSLFAGPMPVARNVKTDIVGTSDLPAPQFNLIIGLNTQIDGQVDFNAKPNFITGLMPVTVAGFSGMLPLHMTKQQAFNAVVDAYGDLVMSGEFRPIKFLTVFINADSTITSHFVRDVTVNGVIYNEAEINASINKVLALSTEMSVESGVKSYLSVPEKLRELLISSSGVLINGSDSIVNFSTKEETTPITVRGLTVVQFNDVVTGTNKTVIMLD